MSYEVDEVIRRDRQVRLRYGVDATTPASATATEVPLFVDERANLDAGSAVVSSITYVPSTALATGANNPTITINRRPAAGGAATALGSLNLTTTALTALVPVAIPVTAANATLNPGDVITYQITTNGAGGVAAPVGYVFADITRT